MKFDDVVSLLIYLREWKVVVKKTDFGMTHEIWIEKK